MNIWHRVDSSFALMYLSRQVSSAQLREAFNQARSTVPNTPAEGFYFEAYWHARISELSMECKISVLRLIDKGKVSSTLLFKEKDQYWVPGIPNYPQIDAAIACNATLYVIQYKVQDMQKKSKGDFDVARFSNNFLAIMFDNNPSLEDITQVIIIYVVPPYRSKFKVPPTTAKKATFRSVAFQFSEKVVSFKTELLIADVNSDDVPDFSFLKKKGTNIPS
jgi:hypothetical protein